MSKPARRQYTSQPSFADRFASKISVTQRDGSTNRLQGGEPDHPPRGRSGAAAVAAVGPSDGDSSSPPRHSAAYVAARERAAAAAAAAAVGNSAASLLPPPVPAQAAQSYQYKPTEEEGDGYERHGEDIAMGAGRSAMLASVYDEGPAPSPVFEGEPLGTAAPASAVAPMDVPPARSRRRPTVDALSSVGRSSAAVARYQPAPYASADAEWARGGQEENEHSHSWAARSYHEELRRTSAGMAATTSSGAPPQRHPQWQYQQLPPRAAGVHAPSHGGGGGALLPVPALLQAGGFATHGGGGGGGGDHGAGPFGAHMPPPLGPGTVVMPQASPDALDTFASGQRRIHTTSTVTAANNREFGGGALQQMPATAQPLRSDRYMATAGPVLTGGFDSSPSMQQRWGTGRHAVPTSSTGGGAAIGGDDELLPTAAAEHRARYGGLAMRAPPMGTTTLDMTPSVVNKHAAPAAVFGEWNHYGQPAPPRRQRVPPDVYIHNPDETQQEEKGGGLGNDLADRDWPSHGGSTAASGRRGGANMDKAVGAKPVGSRRSRKKREEAAETRALRQSAPLNLSLAQQREVSMTEVAKPFSAGAASGRSRPSPSVQQRATAAASRGGTAAAAHSGGSYANLHTEKHAGGGKARGYQPGTLREYGASQAGGYKTMGGLGADLDNPELLQKQAMAARAKAYARQAQAADRSAVSRRSKRGGPPRGSAGRANADTVTAGRDGVDIGEKLSSGAMEWGRATESIQRAQEQRSRAREYAARVPKPKARARQTDRPAKSSSASTTIDYLSDLERQHADQQRMVAAIAAEAAGY